MANSKRSTSALKEVLFSAIDVCKAIVSAYEKIFDMKLDLIIAVDSKDLYTTLSTQKQSIDKSILGDIGVIRYEFETKPVLKLLGYLEK